MGCNEINLILSYKLSYLINNFNVHFHDWAQADLIKINVNNLEDLHVNLTGSETRNDSILFTVTKHFYMFSLGPYSKCTV